MRELSQALLDLVPFVLLIGGTIGSIYLGWVTPTEAAAVGCVLAWSSRRSGASSAGADLRKAMRATVLVCGNILLHRLCGLHVLLRDQLGRRRRDCSPVLVGLKLSRLEFFLALFVLYTVLGCLVESLGMIVITVPLLYPVLLKYGIDPVWFGVILVVFIEMGQISPPIGINLFVIQSIWDGKLGDVVMGTIPFHLIMFVLLGMLVIWPEIATLASRRTWVHRHDVQTATLPIPTGLKDHAEPPSRAAPAHGGARHRRGARLPTTASPRAWSRSRASMRSTSPAPASR